MYSISYMTSTLAWLIATVFCGFGVIGLGLITITVLLWDIPFATSIPDTIAGGLIFLVTATMISFVIAYLVHRKW